MESIVDDLSEELVQAEDLRQEDTGADEDARDQTQEASQVLWRNLTQIHRHDAERDTCSERSREEVILKDYILILTGSYSFLHLVNKIFFFFYQIC